jgi:mRNA degradation ribonuclease J1/J2
VLEKLQTLNHTPPGDEQGIGRLMRDTLANYAWSTYKRKPMVVPVVMEV